MDLFNKKKEYTSEDNKLLYKRHGKAKIVFALIFIFFVMYTASIILPFVWVFISSFKDGMEFADITRSSFLLPQEWLFSNWSLCFSVLEVNKTSFFGMLFNSVWYVAVGGAISIFFEAIVTYVVSKYNHFKITKILYALVIFFLTFPVMGKTSASYKILYGIGIADTPWYVILLSMSGMGNFLILVAAWDGVSDSYAEAARIDGAGHYIILFKIMLPMIKGTLVALSILTFISKWNAYDNILMFLPSYPTLATGLYLFNSVTTRMANIPVYFCGVLLSIIPTLTVFIIFSDTIMKNVTAGGIKG